MEDRKLYHLVNGEFVLNGMPSVHTAPTYEEVATHIAILTDVGFFDDPIAESVPAWSGFGDGKRSDAVQASVYDAMMAEIMDERNAEKAKVRNRRRENRKHPENKCTRQKEKIRRIHRLYGLCFEDGYGWSWEYKSGAKKHPEYEADIIRNMKSDEMDRIARADWELEQALMCKEQVARARKMSELNEWLKYA